MAELESSIEKKLIQQLISGESQWTYRPDIRDEDALWANLRKILENNNKDVIGDKPLTDREFEQVKNQLSFSSFYAAAKWITGENGIAHVSVQRDIEKIQLMVLNRAHNNGGTSVYEVINQYRALKDFDAVEERDRRFDVTLLINGLPLIHIELKNREHSYKDGFYQIKKYINEGKFTGLFSCVQMFVVSNAVDTRYIAASEDLNEKFLTKWTDSENNVISNYLDFAAAMLKIPEAHQLVTQYTVMDNDTKKLIVLRPYQIHAIESVAKASKEGKSGYIWHTTGAGKTLESYKTARNLLLDVPGIDKTIFLVDRKDLDNQTAGDFKSYAENDIIDVEGTDNTFELKKKLASKDRRLIVTTRQKLGTLITKWLPGKEDTAEYQRIKNLRIAFVVDECHRTLSPEAKQIIEKFFSRSLWYGYTGTPRFGENAYAVNGALPRTTDELYGECLHSYTVRDAIRDDAVLGFSVEHLGPKELSQDASGKEINEDLRIYDTEDHMLSVLDVILNKSAHKFGLMNGSGKTYEAILTTSSISKAQAYYKMLKKVVAGETNIQISEEIRKVLPDFPKFAITYSVSENEETSGLNQQEMAESIRDYNEMFDAPCSLSKIDDYNKRLNERLSRKKDIYLSRAEQLDLVIVVDRLLTGFNAPCLSTLFVDRQPMKSHDIIQALSRTNRIFDVNKRAGQIVTFQSPGTFRHAINEALRLYSQGGEKEAKSPEWEDVEKAFKGSIAALKIVADTPATIPIMTIKEKKHFLKVFREFDKWFSQLKTFTNYADKSLSDYGMSDEEYEEYVGHYYNVVEELRVVDPGPDDPQEPVDYDYELKSYEREIIDYEYITALMQLVVDEEDDEARNKLIEEVQEYINVLGQSNEKLANLMQELLNNISSDAEAYKDSRPTVILSKMREEAIHKVVIDFVVEWNVNEEALMYAVEYYKPQSVDIPGLQNIKDTSDYDAYKLNTEEALPKFKYFQKLKEELLKLLNEEIVPLRDGE